ncbi:hypothetical protein [Kitasatospora sp. NPDC017646]|uniref:hypothetical protein n=1 Tax=Kitasatospora sp. NPDC017646 TaxID=3364024 RepID=UPI0037A62925
MLSSPSGVGAPTVLAAARNNASWCEVMCRAFGFPGETTGVAWVSPRNTLAYYPNLVTLSPSISGAEVLETLQGGVPGAPGSSGPLSVKDSFGCLDLLPGDYEVLFEAEWIHRPTSAAPPGVTVSQVAAGKRWRRITGLDDLWAWETAWGGTDRSARAFPEVLLSEDGVVFLGGFSDERLVAGAVLHLSDGVAGVSNVFGPEGESASTWAGVVSCALREVPGADLVGYERGEGLAAAAANGFAPIGPLRVWQQNVGSTGTE